MGREDLIVAKGEVQARIAQARRRLERARGELEQASGLRRRWLAGRAAQLEDQLNTSDGRREPAPPAHRPHTSVIP